MTVFVFRSEQDRHQFALASDRAGVRLPADLGPWYRTSGAAMSSAVGLPESVQRAIEIRGYILMRIDPAMQQSDAAMSQRSAA